MVAPRWRGFGWDGWGCQAREEKECQSKIKIKCNLQTVNGNFEETIKGWSRGDGRNLQTAELVSEAGQVDTINLVDSSTNSGS